MSFTSILELPRLVCYPCSSFPATAIYLVAFPHLLRQHILTEDVQFVVSSCSSAVISDNSFSPPFFSLLVYSDSRVILSSIRFCFWHVHVADLLLCFKQNNFVEILIFQEISICHVNK